MTANKAFYYCSKYKSRCNIFYFLYLFLALTFVHIFPTSVSYFFSSRFRIREQFHLLTSTSLTMQNNIATKFPRVREAVLSTSFVLGKAWYYVSFTNIHKCGKAFAQSQLSNGDPLLSHVNGSPSMNNQRHRPSDAFPL